MPIQSSYPRTRRALLWAGGTFLLLVLALGGTVIAFRRTFYPTPPEPNFPQAEDLRTAQLQDLEYFEHHLALDRSYSSYGLVAARELLTTYREEAGTLSAAEFDLAISRMAGLADNGHSQLDVEQLARRHNGIPCRLYRFAEGYYIVRARPACIDLLGGRILAVNGRGIEGVVDELYPIVGGPRNRFDQIASTVLLESPALLHAAGVGSDPGRILIRVLRHDGSQVEVEFAADPADSEMVRRSGDEILSPELIDGEEMDWASILSAETEIPFFLQEWEIPFRMTFLEDVGALLIQLRTNQDVEDASIRDFVSHLRREAKEVEPRAIVLDLRFDQGGDFTTTASLMKDLTDLAVSVEQVFVLTGAWTFSAGITNVALARDHGGEKVTLVGEPVGDRLRFWGEGGRVQLPNSGLSLGFATGLHDYSGSCFGEPGCFWTFFLHPVSVESLDPDIRVNYTIADYLALRDPALDRAIETLESSGSAATAQRTVIP
jgi:hypothetical protein